MRRDLKKQKSRKAILKASRRLFSTCGFERSTIDDIAEMAGVSRATLYNYFPNKDSLLLGIAEGELSKIQDLIQAELDNIGPKEKLLRVLEQFSVDSMPYRNLNKKIYYLNSFSDSFLRPTRLAMESVLVSLVEEGRSCGVFKPGYTTAMIVDLSMAVYLTVLFGWSDPHAYAEEEFRAKVRSLAECMLEGAWNTPEPDASRE